MRKESIDCDCDGFLVVPQELHAVVTAELELNPTGTALDWEAIAAKARCVCLGTWSLVDKSLVVCTLTDVVSGIRSLV